MNEKPKYFWQIRNVINMKTVCSKVGFFFMILYCTVFPAGAQSHSEILFSGIDNKNVFEISKIGKDAFISSEWLKFSISLKKPETLPAINDPARWIVLKDTITRKHLFGGYGNLNTVIYSTNLGELCTETWLADERNLIAFRHSITNKTNGIIRLNFLFPFYIAKNNSFVFGEISEWRILKQFREKNDYPVVSLIGSKEEKQGIPIVVENFDGSFIIPKPSSKNDCDPFLMINSKNGEGKNLMIAYQSYYFHLADISISIDDKQKLNEISANCNFESVEIPSNGIRTSQWVSVTIGDDPNKMISEYSSNLLEFHDVEIPEKNAPAAYCTWYYYGGSYNETEFKENIAQFRKDRIPFDVFLIDACWDNDRWGDFEANMKQFPSGMKWAAEEIMSVGYIPGIWTCPFIVDQDANLVKDKPEWLLKNSNGEYCIFPMGSARHFILDLTYPGVTQYLEDNYRKFSKDWGYRYYKFDFMRATYSDVDQQFHNKSVTSLEAYRMGLEAIRRGVGNDSYISVCGGHYGGSFGIAQSQRSGSDVLSIWRESELYKYRQNILRTWMSDLWHIDPDAMMVRRKTDKPFHQYDLAAGFFTDDEAFTNSINQFVGGNLLTFSEKFSTIDEDRKMLYKHVIPVPNASSRALDLFNPMIPEKMLTSINPLSKNLGEWKMLSLINWYNKSRDFLIPLDDKVLGSVQEELFIIFDFQSQAIISRLLRGDTLRIEGVKPHQSRLLKILPWDGQSAIFVGTDLNFSCGGVEISDIKYEQRKISGLLDTPWYVPVTLTFLVPSGENFKQKQMKVLPGQKQFYLQY
jgi:hypothetical protein